MPKPKNKGVSAKILPGYEMIKGPDGKFALQSPPAVPWPTPPGPEEAARAFGRMGGMAGKGKSKARDSKKMRKAALKRWKNKGK